MYKSPNKNAQNNNTIISIDTNLVSSNQWPWTFNRLPFIYAPLATPKNGNSLPDFLPFSLNIDKTTNTLIQIPNPSITQTLTNAYQISSTISGMMEDEGIGRNYAEDFLNFLKKTLRTEDFQGMKILEIGCGTGYLLHRLNLLGADVIGIEPGAHGQTGSKKYGVKIIQDFFPSPKIQDKFDLIILFSVLEHIENPFPFLKTLLKHKRRNGRIALAVPNCEPYIANGDISMLIHEHWRYYTAESLRQTIKSGIGYNVDIRKSSYGGSVYAISTNHLISKEIATDKAENEIKQLIMFRKKAEKNLGDLKKYFLRAAADNKELGFFIPSRVINALSILNDEISLPRIRFFDDNHMLHGKYFPGFNIRVESRASLLENPPDEIVIFSHSFGGTIAKELDNHFKGKCPILLWNDIFQ